MAIFTTNDGTLHKPHDVDFAAIWEHYRSANFLYPAKLATSRTANGSDQ